MGDKVILTLDSRAKYHALKRALKLCPGREAIEDVRALTLMLDDGDAKTIERVVECLLSLRMVAHGGAKEPPAKHWVEP